MANIVKLISPVCMQHTRGVLSFVTSHASRFITRLYSVHPKQTTAVTCDVSTCLSCLSCQQSLALNTSYSLYIQKRFKHIADYPPLTESELEERFIRGSGPGGQKINKTSNCVMLKHIPTGIVVKCQESRSLDTNRERARRHMQERLDWYYNREQSVLAQQKKEIIQKKLKSKSATNRKLKKLKLFKQREGLT